MRKDVQHMNDVADIMDIIPKPEKAQLRIKIPVIIPETQQRGAADGRAEVRC